MPFLPLKFKVNDVFLHVKDAELYPMYSVHDIVGNLYIASGEVFRVKLVRVVNRKDQSQPLLRFLSDTWP